MGVELLKNVKQKIIGAGNEERRYQPGIYDENLELYRECQALEDRLKRRNLTLDRAQREHKGYMHQMILLEDKLKEAQAQLSTVQQDLSANVSFAPHEGTLDSEELTTKFEGLCNEIEATAARILQRVPAQLLSEQFTGYRGHNDSGVFTKQEIKFMKMARIVSEGGSLTCFDILLPLFWHVLCTDIHTQILGGFTSNLDENKSEFLEALYEKIRGSESQEQGARWRAMTYTHMRRDESKSTLLSAEQSLQKISSRLRDFFSASYDLISIEECRPEMEGVFKSAATFWSSAQTMCTKYHVEVIGSSYSLLKSDDVIQGYKKERPTEVILTIRLGLVGSRLEEGPDSKPRPKKAILCQRCVIGDNWAGATYTPTR